MFLIGTDVSIDECVKSGYLMLLHKNETIEDNDIVTLFRVILDDDFDLDTADDAQVFFAYMMLNGGHPNAHLHIVETSIDGLLMALDYMPDERLAEIYDNVGRPLTRESLSDPQEFIFWADEISTYTDLI